MLYSILKLSLFTLNQFRVRMQFDWRSTSSFNSISSLKSSIGFGMCFQILPITLKIFHFSFCIHGVCIKLRAQFFPSTTFCLEDLASVFLHLIVDLYLLIKSKSKNFSYSVKFLLRFIFDSQYSRFKKIKEEFVNITLCIWTRLIKLIKKIMLQQ